VNDSELFGKGLVHTPADTVVGVDSVSCSPTITDPGVPSTIDGAVVFTGTGAAYLMSTVPAAPAEGGPNLELQPVIPVTEMPPPPPPPAPELAVAVGASESKATGRYC